MFVMATNYGDNDLSWITDLTDDYIIYDRSNCGLPKTIKRENFGDADYDKLSYLVDNYYNLPDVFIWTKSNLFKFITPEEFKKVKNNADFTPLLTASHITYEPICRYADNGIYEELNNSWYLASVPADHFQNYGEFAREFHLPNPKYLQFAPGGSYILTRERVHRYGVDFYDKMRSILPYCQRPGEAHMCERSYYNLWS